MRNPDEDLMVRASWLYYAHGLGQEEVANRLGVSRTKVTRLLSSARDEGIVKISVDHDMTETLALSDWIARTYNLRECLITPLQQDSDTSTELTDNLARQSVGMVAADYIARHLKNIGPATVGIGSGRTIAEMIQCFPTVRKPNMKVVSLLGSPRRDNGTSAYLMASNFAQVTAAEAYPLPAPILTSSAHIARTLETDEAIRNALEMGRGSDFNIISCAHFAPGNTYCEMIGVHDTEKEALDHAGVVCEIAGVFLTENGALADIDLNERMIGVGLENLIAANNIILAATPDKALALQAILLSGIASTIIIDHSVAEILVRNAPKIAALKKQK
ncbi:sugar-binding transcriptional regulator [Pseudovibrio flavus]|uniref:sugar-binding transcriptional regulator n=1 Tax=Pseudovibrio flavus TaxID=2529854 RepID=UPI003527AE44